jgi:putrescine transport system ATP-binding protein
MTVKRPAVRGQLGAVRRGFAPWDNPAIAPLVRFEAVSKRFGDHAAVDGVSLDLYAGEFFALLGPSGCGKTSLMRLLAGFEAPDAGRILLDGEDLADKPPHERPVNMMFQSYALFPHLSVAQNIAYGLQRQRLPKTQIADRVEQMLALVKLDGLGGRKPAQLSGGQQQRVALARALARRPRLLLLDEPLGALDRKLREETQFELIDIQRELGAAFLVVTHDQEEAMVLAHRIGVMSAGQIVQVGRPADVYEAPANRAVAGFLGEVNLFEATVTDSGPPLARFAAADAPGGLCAVDDDCPAAGSLVTVAVRPEKMRLWSDQPPAGTDNVLAGEVWDIGYTGDWTNYVIGLAGDRTVRVARANAERRVERPVGWDDKVWVSFNPDAAMVLTE